MSRTDEKLNVLDYLQLIWFDFLIRRTAVKKRDTNCVHSTIRARKRVVKRLEKVGYSVYVFSSGCTKIGW